MRAKADIVVRLALCGVVAWLAAACVWLESLPKAFAPSYAPMGIGPYLVAAFVLVAGAAWVTRRSKRLLKALMFSMAVGAIAAMIVAPVSAQSYESTMDEFQGSPVSFRPTWLIGGALIGAVMAVLWDPERNRLGRQRDDCGLTD